MQDNQGVTPSGPGSRPSGGADKSSPAKPSIPNADDVRLLSAGPDPRGGFTFSFADGEENGVIRILAEHLYEMMGVGTPHELNCVQMEVIPCGFAQSYTLTLQKAGGKSPLALKAEAVKLLHQTLDAIETGRSEPLFIMRDAIRNWLADDLTAQAIEARQRQDRETGLGPKDESAVTK